MCRDAADLSLPRDRLHLCLNPLKQGTPLSNYERRFVIALVTGAASGLGRATAQRLLKNGAKVVVVDLPNALEGEGLEKLKASTPEFSENPDNVLFAPCDVTSEDDVKAALDNAEGKFGGNVNVAVNCAGIAIAAKPSAKKARTLCPIFKRFWT